MPNISTFVPLPGMESGGGGILEQLLGAAPGILAQFGIGGNGGNGGAPPGALALPGGAPLFGGITGMAGGIDLPFIDIAPQGSTCITPRQSTTRRLPSRVDVPTMDASGNVRFTTFKNMGRPVLWTGDFAAAKRVKRVASRARRAGGR